MSEQRSSAPVPGGDQGGGASQFTVTELAPGRYAFFQRVTLDGAIDHVWAKVRNFQQLVKILIPTAGFDWVEGGNPGRVPARYEITFGGDRVVEEIVRRDDFAHSLTYHLIVPGLGMQAYVGEIFLFKLSERQTALEYTRDITLQPGASIEPLKQLAPQQLAALQAHFAKGA
jgi:hypothetical protein